MEWLDAHAGSVQAMATLVLVLLTAYYAWATRLLVQQTRTALRATARTTLEARLDRVSELLIQNPELSASMDEPPPQVSDGDRRFHLANMMLAVLEEAHTQYERERSMPEQDWRAWAATMEQMLHRRYMVGHWQRVGAMYGDSFRRYVDGLHRPPPA